MACRLPFYNKNLELREHGVFTKRENFKYKINLTIGLSYTKNSNRLQNLFNTLFLKGKEHV
jgi:hypothetical protein